MTIHYIQAEETLKVMVIVAKESRLTNVKVNKLTESELCALFSLNDLVNRFCVVFLLNTFDRPTGTNLFDERRFIEIFAYILQKTHLSE